MGVNQVDLLHLVLGRFWHDFMKELKSVHNIVDHQVYLILMTQVVSMQINVVM